MNNGTINYRNIFIVFAMVVAGTAISYTDGLQHRTEISDNINTVSSTMASLIPSSELGSAMP